MKTLVIEPTTLLEIAKIGHERLPCEACGILLRIPYKGKRVWELPNRSPFPHDSFEMLGADIMMEFEDMPEEEWGHMAVWHTHPKGMLYASAADVANRVEVMGNLVVALGDTPEEAKAIWY